MKEKSILYSITQGVYVLTTIGSGCVVDAVSQVSGGDAPLISVAVMKRNYTNEVLKKNDKFALSILSEKVEPKVVETFGMHSSKDYDKFSLVDTSEVEGIKVINDSIGYMVCEIVDTIENDTHTLFIGKVIERHRNNDEKAMSYGYYQEHKEDFVKVKTTSGKTAWVCQICGYIYYGDTLPSDFVCPKCGVGREFFVKKV